MMLRCNEKNSLPVIDLAKTDNREKFRTEKKRAGGGYDLHPRPYAL